MRPRHTLLAVAALTFTIAACGDSNAPDMSHVGLYDMLSVDGDPLPVTVYDVPNNMLQGSVTGTLSGSTLTVEYDGTTVVFSR